MIRTIIPIAKKGDSKKEIDAELKGESKHTDPENPHRDSRVKHFEFFVFDGVGIFLKPFLFPVCLAPHFDDEEHEKD